MDIHTKDTTKKLDYQTMWDKLRKELEYLEYRDDGVTTRPVIVLQYMGFIEQIEEAKKEKPYGDNKDRDSKGELSQH